MKRPLYFQLSSGARASLHNLKLIPDYVFLESTIAVLSFQLMKVPGPVLGSGMAVVADRRGLQHTILAPTPPYYTNYVPTVDIVPDRPIGYGAFGVVW